MRRIRLNAVIVVLLLSTTATLRADVIWTSDGSKLVGTVERVADGKLVILTEIAGRLKIEASRITGISTNRPVNVEVGGKDKLVGPIEALSEGRSCVVRSRLGDISIRPSEITLLWPEGDESPRIAAVREKTQAELEAAKPQWSVVLEGGASRSEGNTDTLEGHGRLDVKRTARDDLLHFYLAGRFSEQDDKRTTNEYYGGTRYENMLRQRWYWYVRTELEFDEFEDLDLRATAAPGVGYYWLQQPEQELKTSAGGGYRHEAYDDGRTEDDVVFDLGLDYRVDVAPWVRFTHSTVYSPDLEDFANYRLRFDTALLIPFKDERWAWKLGMTNEYNSRPQKGLERLDNTYYTSIVLSLK